MTHLESIIASQLSFFTQKAPTKCSQVRNKVHKVHLEECLPTIFTNLNFDTTCRIENNSEIMYMDLYSQFEKPLTLDYFFSTTNFAKQNTKDLFLNHFGVDSSQITLTNLSNFISKRKSGDPFRVVLTGDWKGFENAPLSLGSSSVPCYLTLNKFLATITPMLVGVFRVSGKLSFSLNNVLVTIPVKIRIYDFKPDLVLYLNTHEFLLPKGVTVQDLATVFGIDDWAVQSLHDMCAYPIKIQKLALDLSMPRLLQVVECELKLPPQVSFASDALDLKGITLENLSGKSTIRGTSGTLQWEINKSKTLSNSWLCKLISASKLSTLHEEMKQAKTIEIFLPSVLHVPQLAAKSISFYMTQKNELWTSMNTSSTMLHIPSDTVASIQIPFLNIPFHVGDLLVDSKNKYSCTLWFSYQSIASKCIFLSNSKSREQHILVGMSKSYLLDSIEPILFAHNVKFSQPMTWIKKKFCILTIEFNLLTQQFVIVGSVISANPAQDGLPTKNKFEICIGHNLLNCSMTDLITKKSIELRFNHSIFETRAKLLANKFYTDIVFL